MLDGKTILSHGMPSLGSVIFEHTFQKISKIGTKSLLEREGNGTICTRLMRFAVILL
jgi:hypothetical protein